MFYRRFVTQGALLALCSAWPPLYAASGLGQWSIPEALQAQASVLNEEQLEFITSGAILEFIPERQLEHELATRDRDSLRSLVDDLLSLADRMGYDPERVPPVNPKKQLVRFREISARILSIFSIACVGWFTSASYWSTRHR